MPSVSGSLNFTLGALGGRSFVPLVVSGDLKVPSRHVPCWPGVLPGNGAASRSSTAMAARTKLGSGIDAETPSHRWPPVICMAA